LTSVYNKDIIIRALYKIGLLRGRTAASSKKPQLEILNIGGKSSE